MSTRSSSPFLQPGYLPLSDSPHSDTVEQYGMNGDKMDNTSSQVTYLTSPPISPPIYTKKEIHPPEKITDFNFPTVEHYLNNSSEIDTIKKEPISGEPQNETPNEQSSFSEPVVISTSITTTHVKDLHELCQSHVRLTPFFVFEQRKPQEFSVVLKLVGPEGTKEIVVEGTWPSKRHAKEVASGQGIEYVRNLPKNESLKSITLETLEKEEENWIGLLSDMCNHRKVRPQYIDYATPGSGFSCEVRIGAELGYPGVEEQVFGDKHRAFKNKRSAKTAAAKAAMLWIREQAPSLVGPSTHGSKKSGRSMGSTTGNCLIYPFKATPAQIVNLTCPRLGITTPEYHLSADERTPGMYDITAIIRRPKGPKDVMIGPLKNVYGKKKAKEEMARGVYNWVKKEAERQGLILLKDDP